MANRVRGIRQTLPPNTFVGRAYGRTGPAQQLTPTQVTNALVQQGGLPLPGAPLTAISNDEVLANISGATALPTGHTLTAILDAIFGSTEGNTLQRGATSWQVLAPGTSGYVLTSQGSGALNHWAALPASGTTISGVGAWSGTAGYSVGNVVTYNGSAYLCYSTVSAPAPGVVTWNPSDESSMTLSNGNLTATGTTSAGSVVAGVRADVSASSGLGYFEVTMGTLSNNNTGIGIANSSWPLTTEGALSADSLNAIAIGGIWINGTNENSNWGGITSSGTFGIAIDFTNKLFWIAKISGGVVSGNWNGQSGADPVAEVHGVSFSSITGPWFPSFSSVHASSGEAATANFGATSFALSTLPTGYQAFNTYAAATPNTSPDLDDTHWVCQGSVNISAEMTSGQIPVATGPNTVESGNLQDDLGAVIGLAYNLSGTAYASNISAISVNQFTLIPPAGDNAGIAMIGFTGSGSALRQYCLNGGTLASPGTLASGDIVFANSGLGYNGAAYKVGGKIVYTASQNWTSSVNGTNFNIYTTPNGDTTATISAVFASGWQCNSNGTAPTGGDMGGGTINVQSGYYTQGVMNGTQGYTVATLPAAPGRGARAYVTDATAPTFLGTLTGSGTVVCPVFYNGSAWVAG